MARSSFGNTTSDWLLKPYKIGNSTLVALREGTTVLTFYSAKTAGTQYTDLLDPDGNPTDRISVDGHIVPRFQGPDGIVGMWADKGDGSDREFMEAQDLAAAAAAVVDAEAARDAAIAATSSKVSKGAQVIDIRDAPYNAVCDGSTDDTAAVVAAANAASALAVLTIGGNTYRAGATLFFPAGKTIKLSSLAAPIVLTCNVNGAGATLLAPQTYAQAVLRVGHPTSGNVLHTADISLPDVTKTTPATDFTAGSIGVEIRNLYHSRVRFGRVTWFETAHHYNGVGIGTCYNTIHPGWVDLCKVGYAIKPDVASGGWVNQNTWLAGGVTQSAPNGLTGGTTHRTGYRHVALDGGAGSTVSGNTFVGCSFEGDYSEYFVEFINAANNVFLGSTRFEQGTAGRAVTITTGTDTITTTSTPLGAAVGDPVTFLASGSYASPITAGTIYYVKTVSGNDITISTTSGGATLDLTTAGSGMLAFRAPIVRFDNTSTFNKGNRITEDYNSYPGPVGVIQVGSAAPSPKTPILG